jgi:hypothetical protein
MFQPQVPDFMDTRINEVLYSTEKFHDGRKCLTGLSTPNINLPPEDDGPDRICCLVRGLAHSFREASITTKIIVNTEALFDIWFRREESIRVSNPKAIVLMEM